MSDTLELWTIERLAEYLHLSPLTVRRKASCDPGSIPPRVPGLAKPLWHPHTVDEWVRRAPSRPRKGGRPRMPVA